MKKLNWFSVLDNALGVFDRSISSLQYLVEDQMRRLKGVIFDEGVEAMETLNNSLGGVSGKVINELKLIDQQDGLDELSPLSESDMGSIFDVDSEWEEIRRSSLYWACDTLMFGQVAEPNAASTLSVDTPFRFQYRVPGKGGQATLIALSGFMDDFLGALDYEDRRSTSTQPLSYPHLSKRQSAVKRGTRILRYGDDFIEALKSFSDLDDRGRSYSMWRQILNGLSENERGMYFRFDFLIETLLDPANQVLSQSLVSLTDTARAAIARRGDALFPPFVVQVWIDEEGDEPSKEFIEKYLTLPYAKNGNKGIYIDTNLKSLRLRSLMEVAPESFSNWTERCVRMRDRAREILIGRPTLTEAKVIAIKLARIEDEMREAQLSTRIRILNGVEADSEREQLIFESKLNDALYKGIESPLIKVDVVGVVILSNTPFPSVH